MMGRSHLQFEWIFRKNFQQYCPWTLATFNVVKDHKMFDDNKVDEVSNIMNFENEAESHFTESIEKLSVHELAKYLTLPTIIFIL